MTGQGAAGRGRMAAALVVIVVLIGLSAIGIRFVVAGAANCGSPPLRVAASPEIAPVLREVADG